MTGIPFRHLDDRLGEFAVRDLDPRTDGALLHRWVTHPKATYWQMQDAEPADVVQHYAAVAAAPGHDAMLGLHEGTPAFLVERYDPAHAEVGRAYSVQPGDIGMHFLVAPTDTPVHGFTRAVITTVMTWLFRDPDVRRVVVEPDVRNTAVHTLNATVGFRVAGTVVLEDKRALLSMCTRAAFLACADRTAPSRHPDQAGEAP